MARIFIDGFEGGNLDLWDDETTDCVIASASVASMTGNYCCDLSDSFGELYKTFSSNKTTIGISFDVKFDSVNSVALTLYLYCGAIYLVRIEVAPKTSSIDYSISSIDTEKDSYQFNTIYPTLKFNLQALVTNPSAGYYTYQILHDGSEIMNGNFSYGSSTYFDKIGFKISGSSITTYVDDIVIDDAVIPGSSEIYGLVPYANGTTIEWSAIDSTNFQSVCEIPRDDADYIYTDVFDEIDLFKLTDIPVAGREIKSFYLLGHSQQTVGPPPTEHTQLIVRTDSTNFLGAIEDIHVAGSFGKTEWLLQNSPSSREAWEEADIDALEIGIKLVG